MHRFRISEIKGLLKGEFLSDIRDDALVNDILIDSRRLFKVENTLFFALKSKRNDGHQYIPELYQKGLRNFVVSDHEIAVADFPDANFIIVDKTLQALQMLASAYRKKFDIPVIGITGSNGKTIVKEWLYQLISQDRRVIRSPKSYNLYIFIKRLQTCKKVWQ